MLKKRNIRLFPPKVSSVQQNSGSEFTSDDVGNYSSGLLAPLRLCSHINYHGRFLPSAPFFAVKMSESDGYLSSCEISNIQESESTTSNSNFGRQKVRFFSRTLLAFINFQKQTTSDRKTLMDFSHHRHCKILILVDTLLS